ncbi:hypothetical protein HDZ31DRAFT_30174 [Schizophyllum fasciatum]
MTHILNNETVARQSVCHNISNFSRRQNYAFNPRAAAPFTNETRAVISNIASRTPTPLTANSIFPTLSLPLPGAKPLDYTETGELYERGQKVFVREFSAQNRCWSKWTLAWVVGLSRFRSAAGNCASAYRVSTNLASPEHTLERRYFPCLAEIFPADGRPFVAADPSLCALVWQRLHSVLVRLDDPGDYRGVPKDQIWIPASVVTWRSPTSIRVRCIARPMAGQVVDVHTVLPYTAESITACRGWGYHVLELNGTLIAPGRRGGAQSEIDVILANADERDPACSPPVPWAHVGHEPGDTGFVHIGPCKLPTFACPKRQESATCASDGEPRQH